MGNVWFDDEYIRRQTITSVDAKNIIMFQTLFYDNTEHGMVEERYSKKFYSNKKNLYLFARERKSCNKMISLYDGTSINITPGIALSLKHSLDFNNKRKIINVLLILRKDKEKAIGNDFEILVKNTIANNNLSYKESTMFSERRINKINRKQIVKEKLLEISEAKLVITDRLHSMIFAIITNTICLTDNNSNGKVKEVYDYIKPTGTIFYDDGQTLEYSIIRLLKTKSNEIGVNLNYGELKQVIYNCADSRCENGEVDI